MNITSCSVCGKKVEFEKNMILEHKNKQGKVCYGSFTPTQKFDPFKVKRSLPESNPAISDEDDDDLYWMDESWRSVFSDVTSPDMKHSSLEPAEVHTDDVQEYYYAKHTQAQREYKKV